MPVRVWETPDSRKRHASTDLKNKGTLQYGCSGTSDDQAAGDAITAQAVADWPIGFRGMWLKTVDLTPIGNDIWLGDVQYVNDFDPKEKDPPDTGEYRITISPGDQTARIRFAQENRTTRFPGGATDYKGAIGVDNSDGKITVEGVDIPVPGGSKLDIHYRVPKANITTAYAKTLDGLRGKRNDAAFYGFDEKELLFIGSNVTDSMRGDDEGTFSFIIDQEVTLTYPAPIGDVTKPPHDYVDVVWDYEEDPATHVLIPKPKAVYVHDLIDTADFSQLGIGT